MKKLINDPHTVVRQACEGFVDAHSDIVMLNDDPLFVVRAEKKPFSTVAVISGGGSGHEPAHIGYVGLGMLDAAVPGRIFTSPSPDSIIAAARAVNTQAGVLMIVKNYTGDILNFETAAEFLEIEGISTSIVVVDDDVALGKTSTAVGRRGIAGAVLAEKIAGASAERGDDLQRIAAITRQAVANTASYGVALEPCVPFHTGKPSFDLDPEYIEMGVGIHGERGTYQRRIASADDIVDDIMSAIVDDLEIERDDNVITLVNGLGATSEVELYICHRRVVQNLNTRGIHCLRSRVGNYLTSVNMAGASITVMKVDDELLSLYDAPARTAVWK